MFMIVCGPIIIFKIIAGCFRRPLTAHTHEHCARTAHTHMQRHTLYDFSRGITITELAIPISTSHFMC